MVDAYTRVFITNPEDWDNAMKMADLIRERPELACPHGFNDYGMIDEIRIGDSIFCRGSKRHRASYCTDCDKYKG